VRRRRSLYFETVDQGVEAVRELNRKEQKRSGRERGWRWAFERYPDGVVGERPTDSEDDLWRLSARRFMTSPGSGADYLVTPQVVREERIEKVALWIVILVGFFGAATMLITGLWATIDPDSIDPPSYGFGATTGVVCGFAAGFWIYLNKRLETPLPEKYDEPMEVIWYGDWRDRTSWTWPPVT
jgi:hypothetical protein